MKHTPFHIALLSLAATFLTSAAHAQTIITEPDQGFTPIYNFINTATKTLDMTMYELVDTTAEKDLAALAKKGVTVRVILDQNLEKSSNTTAYNYLNENGVSVHWANPTYSATHQKTITVDGDSSMILTANLTSEYYSTTRDFAVIDTNQTNVAAIEKVFNADFTNATVTPSTAYSLIWSPTDSNTDLQAIINGATQSLTVENEEMSDSTIVTALENAAKRGVVVKVIMTNDDNEYESEFNALHKAGVQIRTYKDTSTTLYIHAKVILADYGVSGAEKIFVGSENFSVASLTKNRELGLTMATASILETFNTVLTSDFTGGTAWTTT